MNDAKVNIERRGDMAILSVPIDQIQSLRIALQPCPCVKTPKSNATASTRRRWIMGLGKVLGGDRYGNTGIKF